MSAPRFYRLVEHVAAYGGATFTGLHRLRREYETKRAEEAKRTVDAKADARRLAQISGAGSGRFAAFEYRG